MGELNFQNVFDKVRKDSVMVHCITNYVTINDVADIFSANHDADKTKETAAAEK